MQKQGTTSSAVAPKRPWSVFTVAIIALLLPPGGAMLTVRNLARLRDLDRRRAGELTVVVFGLYSAGLTLLLLAASPNSTTSVQVAPGVSALLSFGTLAAAYVALRAPYAAWRADNPKTPHASFLSAAGTAIVYAFAMSIVVTVLRLVIAGLAQVFGWDIGRA